MMMASATSASRWAHQGDGAAHPCLVRILSAEDRGDGQQLWESVERLAPLAPNFVSVTYGAGGSTRERTHATVSASSMRRG